MAKVADIEALNNGIAELQSTATDKAATIVSDSAIGFNIVYRLAVLCMYVFMYVCIRTCTPHLYTA